MHRLAKRAAITNRSYYVDMVNGVNAIVLNFTATCICTFAGVATTPPCGK